MYGGCPVRRREGETAVDGISRDGGGSGGGLGLWGVRRRNSHYITHTVHRDHAARHRCRMDPSTGPDNSPRHLPPLI